MILLSVQRPMPAFPAFEGSIIHISMAMPTQASQCFPPTTASHHSGAQSTGAVAICHPRSLWSGDDGVAVSYRSTHDLRLRAWLENPGRPIIPKSMRPRPRLIHPKNRSLRHGIEGASSPRPTHAESVHIYLKPCNAPLAYLNDVSVSLHLYLLCAAFSH